MNSATVYHFACPACGLAAEALGGSGELQSGAAITCAVCGELRDVVTPRRHRRGKKIAPPEAIAAACSVDPAHPAAAWTWPAPCPRCGGAVERGPEVVILD